MTGRRLRLKFVSDDPGFLADDVAVALAVRYALRGAVCAPQIGEGERSSLPPDQIGAWVRDADLVVVVLDARPPAPGSVAEADSSDLLPSESPDAWVYDVGPRCAAAIRGAADHGRELVVVVPAVRLARLTAPFAEAVREVETAQAREDIARRTEVTLRGPGWRPLRVRVRELAGGSERVAERVLAVAGRLG